MTDKSNLILRIRNGEGIDIGGIAVVTIINRNYGSGCKVAIQAPRDLRVLRIKRAELLPAKRLTTTVYRRVLKKSTDR